MKKLTTLIAVLLMFTTPLLAADPPACGETTCELYGTGGQVELWKLRVLTAHMKNKPIVVPGKVCASACAIAVGFALYRGDEVIIDPDATFIPHNRHAISKTQMPPKFMALMVAYEPFKGSDL